MGLPTLEVDSGQEEEGDEAGSGSGSDGDGDGRARAPRQRRQRTQSRSQPSTRQHSPLPAQPHALRQHHPEHAAGSALPGPSSPRHPP